MHFCRKMKYVAKTRFLGILLAQTNEICRHVIGDIVTLFTLGSLKFTLITLFFISTTLYVRYFCQNETLFLSKLDITGIFFVKCDVFTGEANECNILGSC